MRILSLAPSNTEILYALGLDDHIVGVTHLCDYPEEVHKHKKIGSWTETDVDAIKQAKPDVILTSSYHPPQLNKYSGPGEVVHLEPRTIGDIISSIKTIGLICSRVNEANTLIEKIERELFSLSSGVNHAERGPVVYTEEWGDPPMISGNWVPQVVGLAGGHAVLTGPGEPSREVILDELLEADPDILLINWCGADKKTSPEDIRKRKGWDKLRAVKTNRVYAVDDQSVSRPGPRVVDGIKKVRSVLEKDRGLHS
ncbi:cobalamin-binding protein [Patescibacteria group bacterium]